jgi:hypothetical protein
VRHEIEQRAFGDEERSEWTIKSYRDRARFNQISVGDDELHAGEGKPDRLEDHRSDRSATEDA